MRLSFGSASSLSDLRTIGFLAFKHNQQSKGDNFAGLSRKCVFVGYSLAKKGWSLFDLDIKEFFCVTRFRVL